MTQNVCNTGFLQNVWPRGYLETVFTRDSYRLSGTGTLKNSLVTGDTYIQFGKWYACALFAKLYT